MVAGAWWKKNSRAALPARHDLSGDDVNWILRMRHTCGAPGARFCAALLVPPIGSKPLIARHTIVAPIGEAVLYRQLVVAVR